MPGPSDVQDIHILLGGLPRDRTITFARIAPLGGGEWLFHGPAGPACALIEREPGSPSADLYLEPYQEETGRPFLLTLQFDDGQKAEFGVEGGAADPNLRMPGAAMEASWVGQKDVDRVGTGPSVGPDGLIDAQIGLNRLSKGVEIVGVEVLGPGGSEWHSGANPKGKASAELVRRGDDPSKADLFLEFERDPAGSALKVVVHYANGKSDAARVAAGKVDPKRKAPKVVAPTVVPIRVASRWLGQDGDDKVGPGDVHVILDGLPRVPILAAALSDSSRGLWSVKEGDAPFDPGPDAIPMAVLRGDDPAVISLHFPPFRDETGGTMTLRASWGTAGPWWPNSPAARPTRASGPRQVLMAPRLPPGLETT